MASTVPDVSLVGLQRFNLFTSLPPELRLIIWRLSLSPRIVEILSSEYCTVGFYSQAVLPPVLQACQESRNAVKTLYPCCFGSYLQPERVRFNFDLDMLYLDISQEEEGLHRLFGVLKESEMTRLKYVAISEEYLEEWSHDLHRTMAGLKSALKTMTSLKELIIVHDVPSGERNSFLSSREQIKFYAEHEVGEAEEGWAPEIEELPDIRQELSSWKLSSNVRITAVYGRRPPR